MGIAEPLLPTPRTWATNDKATAALLNSNVRDAVSFLQTPPSFALVTTGTTSVPTAAFTPITWGSANVDVYGGWAASPNPSRYTAPVAGWYYCAGVVQGATNATGRRATGLHVNGTVTRQTEMQVNAAGAGTAHTIAGFVFLNKGDYVQLECYQSSGVTLTYAGAGGSFFYGSWVHS
jgi:hypothetical protein